MGEILPYFTSLLSAALIRYPQLGNYEMVCWGTKFERRKSPSSMALAPPCHGRWHHGGTRRERSGHRGHTERQEVRGWAVSRLFLQNNSSQRNWLESHENCLSLLNAASLSDRLSLIMSHCLLDCHTGCQTSSVWATSKLQTVLEPCKLS